MKKNMQYTSTMTTEEKDAIIAAFCTVPVIKVAAVKGKDCLCGCGGRTKGGTYLPGHDSKHKAMLAGGIKSAPKPCGCGCGEYTKGGTFRPGHDAKLLSQLIRTQQEQAKTPVISAAQNAA